MFIFETAFKIWSSTALHANMISATMSLASIETIMNTELTCEMQEGSNLIPCNILLGRFNSAYV